MRNYNWVKAIVNAYDEISPSSCKERLFWAFHPFDLLSVAVSRRKKPTPEYSEGLKVWKLKVFLMKEAHEPRDSFSDTISALCVPIHENFFLFFVTFSLIRITRRKYVLAHKERAFRNWIYVIYFIEWENSSTEIPKFMVIRYCIIWECLDKWIWITTHNKTCVYQMVEY